MNTISRIGLMLFAALFLGGCIQGPWSFWPKDPPLYRGIWVYAHVTAGFPLQEVCFEPIIPLEHTSTRDFAFYESAEISIRGEFNGTAKSLTLTPQDAHPNCFDGPVTEIPAKGQAYSLRAVFTWDSAGTRVTSILTSATQVPSEFEIRKPRTLGAVKLDTVFRNDSIVSLLKLQFGSAVTEALKDPARLDTLAGKYQKEIYGFLGDFTVPINYGDTVSYLSPPLDLLSPYRFTTKRSDDVNGVLMTQYYDTDNGARGLSSFDLIAGQSEPDSADRTDFGHRHRLWFLESYYNPQEKNNFIDTITLSNAYLYIGLNTIYFHAVPKAYSQYVSSAIQNADDSRVRAKTNIEGGYGIFVGMVRDSIQFFVKALPGARTYPFARTQWLVCKKEDDWENNGECRRYLPKFCADSLGVTKECDPWVVMATLDSGEAVNETMSGYEEGIQRWCMKENFPTSNVVCTTPKEDCLVSSKTTLCKERLWNWCADLGWPIDSMSQCGNAFISWMRLEEIQSIPLERERDRWCKENASDPQCKY